MQQLLRQIAIIATLLFYSPVSFAQIPPLKITHLTGSFYVFTTYSVFKGQPVSANGLYFLTSKGVVMLDTPWDTTQFQPLLDSIKLKHNADVVLCIATHSHEDRTAGLEFLQLKGVKTYTTQLTDQISKMQHQKRAEFCFTSDTIFVVGGDTLQTFYAGEGHTKDNIIIWFGKYKVLYGGCLIKSTEATDLGYTGEANLKVWPETLKKIKQKFPHPLYIIPGHQDWTNAKSIDHTLHLIEKNGN